MPGNLRSKTGSRGSGRTEADYLKARRTAIRRSQICSICRQAIDLKLKPICQFVKTDSFTVETAHTIPLTCGDYCKESGHQRKAHPWGPSADHKIPVDELPAGSPLLVSAKNLDACHLICNQRKGNRVVRESRARVKNSRDWFA